MTHTKPNMAQPQKREKEKSKNEPQKQNQSHTPKTKDPRQQRVISKINPLTITQINLNHAKVPSLTLQENQDRKWNTDLKHIICIQEPYKNYKTGRIKNTSAHYKKFL